MAADIWLIRNMIYANTMELDLTTGNMWILLISITVKSYMTIKYLINDKFYFRNPTSILSWKLFESQLELKAFSKVKLWCVLLKIDNYLVGIHWSDQLFHSQNNYQHIIILLYIRFRPLSLRSSNPSCLRVIYKLKVNICDFSSSGSVYLFISK